MDGPLFTRPNTYVENILPISHIDISNMQKFEIFSFTPVECPFQAYLPHKIYPNPKNVWSRPEQGQASGMDWTLHTDLWKSETSRDIKK